jgi:hypothetical protein
MSDSLNELQGSAAIGSPVQGSGFNVRDSMSAEMLHSSMFMTIIPNEPTCPRGERPAERRALLCVIMRPAERCPALQWRPGAMGDFCETNPTVGREQRLCRVLCISARKQMGLV